MSSLRNTGLRARDIFKLAGYKYLYLRWDPGCNESSEWVIASTTNEEHRLSLISWLLSKEISPNTDVIAVTSISAPVSRYKWMEVQANPEIIFDGASVTLYEADFKWQLQYAEEGIARFGRYERA